MNLPGIQSEGKQMNNSQEAVLEKYPDAYAKERPVIRGIGGDGPTGGGWDIFLGVAPGELPFSFGAIQQVAWINAAKKLASTLE